MSQLVDVIMPDQNEGTKATVLRWCRQVGEQVVQNEPLLELETDKVTVEVPSPVSGELVDILKSPNDAVEPQMILARVRAGVATGTAASKPAAAAVSAPVEAASAAREKSAGLRTTAQVAREMPLSPAVRRLLAEHSLSPHAIPGTGRDGRITAQDIQRLISQGDAKLHSAPAGHATAADIKPPPVTAALGRKVPHSAIRRRIAEHMLHSMTTAPHVTTLFEADLTRVLAHRDAQAQLFADQGAKLTLTAYFVAAAVRALQAVPEVNSTFHADHLEIHADCNVGVGTALGNQGLIVPVLHKAQTLNLLGITRRLNELVGAARASKLAPESVRGGTFTISNHGVSGSLLAAPIVINQPQVAILGIGKLERRVVAEQIDGEDVIRVRPMCYVTLTIDHRALDAFQANAFLSTLVQTLQEWPKA